MRTGAKHDTDGPIVSGILAEAKVGESALIPCVSGASVFCAYGRTSIVGGCVCDENDGQ